MQRVTVTLDDDLLAELDRMVEDRGYQNRSEAMRDLARAGLRQRAEERGTTTQCVAALIYVYDHEARELSKRLVRSFHDHHDLAVSTMHVHLDHESCMEMTVLKGATANVQAFADRVIAERGVRHGRLVVVPVDIADEHHDHEGDAPHAHGHVHVKDAG